MPTEILGMGTAGDVAYNTFAFLGGLMYSVIIIFVVIIAFLILMRLLGGANKTPRAAAKAVSKNIFGKTKSIYKSHNPLKRGWY